MLNYFVAIDANEVDSVFGGVCECTCNRNQNETDLCDIGRAKSLEECSNICLANGWKIEECINISSKKEKDE